MDEGRSWRVCQTRPVHERRDGNENPSNAKARAADGVGDGVADQVDRLHAIGNGQVPAVAALAWKTLDVRLTANDQAQRRALEARVERKGNQ